jgi:hypothetical protein
LKENGPDKPGWKEERPGQAGLEKRAARTSRAANAFEEHFRQ